MDNSFKPPESASVRFQQLAERTSFPIWERVFRRLNWHLPRRLFHYDRTLLYHADSFTFKDRDFSQFRFRFADRDDVDLMAATGVNRDTFLTRLQRGDRCALALQDDRVASWNWTATGRLYLLAGGIVMNLPDEGVFLYDVLTQPWAQKRGLYMGCLQLQWKFHSKHGRVHFFPTVAGFNTGSIQAHLRLGFNICGETQSLRLLGVTMCRYRYWPLPSPGLSVHISEPPDPELKVV